MHEFSVAQALIDEILNETKQAGIDGRVQTVRLAIGRISGVNIDALRFAFEVLTQDTELANVNLEIRQPKPVCSCSDCGTKVEVDDITVACPNCSSYRITITGGRQMLLESIELETS